jgi:adenosylhomocysteine nucleosidase
VDAETLAVAQALKHALACCGPEAVVAGTLDEKRCVREQPRLIVGERAAGL